MQLDPAGPATGEALPRFNDFFGRRCNANVMITALKNLLGDLMRPKHGKEVRFRCSGTFEPVSREK